MAQNTTKQPTPQPPPAEPAQTAGVGGQATAVTPRVAGQAVTAVADNAPLDLNRAKYVPL